MVIKPYHKPTPYEVADYVIFVLKSILIGFTAALLTAMLPLYGIIFLFHTIRGKHGQNKKEIDRIIESDQFGSFLDWISEDGGSNVWNILLISSLFFIIRYFILLYKKNQILKITVEGEKINVNYQRVFNKPETISCRLSEIEKFNFEYFNGKDTLLNERIKISFSISNISFKINTNKSPWHIKNSDKLFKLKELIKNEQT